MRPFQGLQMELSGAERNPDGTYPAGAEGELVFLSPPCGSPGYLHPGQPALRGHCAVRATGDIFRADGRGRFAHVCRKDDLIIHSTGAL